MRDMGRRRTTHHGLPPHMARKGQRYYYVTNDKPRKWLALGTDYREALVAWAKLEGQPIPESARTFGQVAAWYRVKVMPGKAKRTQDDNELELKRLEAVFGESPIETITPMDVRAYLDGRVITAGPKKGQPATVRANREIALLSHVINFARERGFTTMANPCAGIRKHAETGRERYMTDAEFEAIYAAGDAELRDALDLLLLTSQRPGDVVKARRTDLVDGHLRVRQGKTGTMVRIAVEGELAAALDRMMSRPRTATGVYLVQDDAGQPLTYWMLEARFAKARAAATKENPALADLQLRDIRGKAATDVGDLAHAQALLGHKSRAMTERYVKARSGHSVAPHNRKRKGAA